MNNFRIKGHNMIRSLTKKNTLWMTFDCDKCQMLRFHFPNQKIYNPFHINFLLARLNLFIILLTKWKLRFISLLEMKNFRPERIVFINYLILKRLIFEEFFRITLLKNKNITVFHPLYHADWCVPNSIFIVFD